jgi:hypothetical protein
MGRKIFMFKNLIAGTVAAMALCLAVTSAQAETINFKAQLNGASEVPANDSKGTGDASLKYDSTSKKLDYTLNYSGLSGDATAAHFHGPAAAGANAGVELQITIGKSPISGSAVLNDTQAADLLAGKWYVNVHTAAHPGGEIRGQVSK